MTDDLPEPIDVKYVVLKRPEYEEWLMFMEQHSTPGALDQRPEVLQDAVVLRRQDLFAGPALHVYAHCISMVSKYSDKTDLQKVADYFHEQAVVADAEGWKLPD